MFDIDLIIPCYGNSKLINRGIASIATQWKKEYIHITLVNDCSPNTDCNYQDLVDRYKDEVDIRCITMPENMGQGLARQYGVDNMKHEWFMFMDEDDQLGNGLAISLFVGAAESHFLDINPDNSINMVLDKKGKPKLNKKGEPIPKRKENIPELAIVSGPLFEFDSNHTHVIPAENRIWLNSKLYNRKFIKKHKIRFNEAQSRHAEDYYFMSCFFHCLDNDPDYVGILLNNDGLYYLWYPNQESQSRVDPHYGFMLSGYTMDGSVNILKFIKKNKTIKWNEEIEKQYNGKLLNMTVYSFFTFLSFVRHVASTDYVPKLEQDWYLLRDACNWMRKETRNNWDNYKYMEVVEQLFLVKNNTDVQYTEPWVEFEDYIWNDEDVPEFEWTFEELLECKKTYRFDESGVLIEWLR